MEPQAWEVCMKKLKVRKIWVTCSKCGAHNKPTNLYCDNCGAML